MRDIALEPFAFVADAGVRDRLVRYAELLLERSARTNLTAARDVQGVAAHVRDSLLLAPLVRSPLVDVGSGGGFPGVPLAVATGVRVTLVESVAKKAAFLRDAVAALDLDAEVVAARAEDAGREPRYRGRFASATARAVGALTTVLELTVPLLAVGGRAFLQRGRVTAEERQSLADAALVLGAAIRPDVTDPASDERCVIVVEKMADTAARFPRRAGIPAKRPLCVPPGAGAHAE